MCVNCCTEGAAPVVMHMNGGLAPMVLQLFCFNYGMIPCSRLCLPRRAFWCVAGCVHDVDLLLLLENTPQHASSGGQIRRTSGSKHVWTDQRSSIMLMLMLMLNAYAEWLCLQPRVNVLFFSISHVRNIYGYHKLGVLRDSTSRSNLSESCKKYWITCVFNLNRVKMNVTDNLAYLEILGLY